MENNRKINAPHHLPFMGDIGSNTEDPPQICSLQSNFAPPISLDSFLITNPVSTFLFRIQNSKIKSSEVIYPDDLIAIVDRSKKPKDFNIILVSDDNYFHLKQFRENSKGKFIEDCYLDKARTFSSKSHHGSASTYSVNDFHICGVVTSMIQKFI